MTRRNRSTSTIYAYAETLRRQMLTEFMALEEVELVAAEDATNGIMLNARAKSCGMWVDAVFRGSPSVVAAYASEELKDYLREHPRTTRTKFEKHWLENYLNGESAPQLVA